MGYSTWAKESDMTVCATHHTPSVTHTHPQVSHATQQVSHIHTRSHTHTLKTCTYTQVSHTHTPGVTHTHTPNYTHTHQVSHIPHSVTHTPSVTHTHTPVSHTYTPRVSHTHTHMCLVAESGETISKSGWLLQLSKPGDEWSAASSSSPGGQGPSAAGGLSLLDSQLLLLKLHSFVRMLICMNWCGH